MMILIKDLQTREKIQNIQFEVQEMFFRRRCEHVRRQSRQLAYFLAKAHAESSFVLPARLNPLF